MAVKWRTLRAPGDRTRAAQGWASPPRSTRRPSAVRAAVRAVCLPPPPRGGFQKGSLLLEKGPPGSSGAVLHVSNANWLARVVRCAAGRRAGALVSLRLC